MIFRGGVAILIYVPVLRLNFYAVCSLLPNLRCVAPSSENGRSFVVIELPTEKTERHEIS
jgi:hypothetical protein